MEIFQLLNNYRLGELLQQDASETTIKHSTVLTKKNENIETTSRAVDFVINNSLR